MEKNTIFFFSLQLSLSLKGRDRLLQSPYANTEHPPGRPFGSSLFGSFLTANALLALSRTCSRSCYISCYFDKSKKYLVLKNSKIFQGNVTPRIKTSNFQRSLLCTCSDLVLLVASLSIISEHMDHVWYPAAYVYFACSPLH